MLSVSHVPEHPSAMFPGHTLDPAIQLFAQKMDRRVKPACDAERCVIAGFPKFITLLRRLPLAEQAIFLPAGWSKGSLQRGNCGYGAALFSSCNCLMSTVQAAGKKPREAALQLSPSVAIESAAGDSET
jgi:hypothetical protein